MATEFQVTFDSADPAAHAAFWAEAVHYVQAPPPAGFDSWGAALDAWGVSAEHRNDRAAQRNGNDCRRPVIVCEWRNPHARLRPDDAEQEVRDATADVAIERDAPGGFRVDRAAVGNVACRHPLLALLHRRQEFVVGLGLAHLGQQQLHRFNR